MEAYLRIVRALPRPTQKQIGGFVEYVCSAHSWYKHIPIVPPGVAFHLFMNPHVACDKSVLPSGQIEFLVRKERGFHYAEWPTEEYREQCGYLDYVCSRSSVPAIYLLKKEPTLDELQALEEEDRVKQDHRLPVPDEILRAGEVNLTGVIHTWASQPFPWLRHLGRPGFEESSWPAETGGRDAFVKILETAERCDSLSLKDLEDFESCRLELDHLLNPERERQKALMRATVGRVLQLVYG